MASEDRHRYGLAQQSLRFPFGSDGERSALHCGALVTAEYDRLHSCDPLGPV
ncbi:hypothetical protein [Ferrimicrobium sp.]|uniref:hypothetical protein n=1 Tax=Ferrimicrobium sp. TaxID=2926050 RepID=UPI00261104AE|nr:hypothetical protein [Ferrimicrobium sp.]